MKRRIARKIVKSWPSSDWRYRRSTFKKAYRKANLTVLGTMYGFPVVLDEHGPFSFHDTKVYFDARRPTIAIPVFASGR